jgi:thioredoxin-like negative regulator of GroEL
MGFAGKDFVMKPHLATPLLELNDKNFDASVLFCDVPVVVEFFTEWERPWRGLTGEEWNELTARYGERIRYACLETGKNRDIATRYRVESIPNVFVYCGEKVVAQFFGRAKLAEVSDAVRRALQLRARSRPVAEAPRARPPVVAQRPHAVSFA